MTAPLGLPNPPLTLDAAAALIRHAFPTVDASGLQYLGSGWLYDAFLTADEWVFRFPRWDWSGGIFEPEARIHSFVAEILPTQIRTPRVELMAPPSEQFPYAIAGHRFIPGIAADALDNELMPTFARELALFLSILHSTPVPVAGAAGIHQVTLDDPGRRGWLENGIATALKLRGVDPIMDPALSWLSARPAAPEFHAPLQLIHGGLAPDHILVDPTTGFLVGVVDWTDTSLGDAARDFVFLVTWQGWKFAESVLRQYPRAVDKEFRARLRDMAQLMSLMGLAYAHEQGQDLGPHVRAVKNAFAPGEPAAP
jgi:aminoglycoside phosphotransferase (APT) family kinase protein